MSRLRRFMKWYLRLLARWGAAIGRWYAVDDEPISTEEASK